MDTYTCLILGATGNPIFGFLVTSLLSFKARMASLTHTVEENMVNVPCDSSLVLHLLNSLTLG